MSTTQLIGSVLAIIVVAATSAVASIGELPLADLTKMRGTWEGISADEPRLTVLQLEPGGKSFASVAVGAAPFLSTFRITLFKVNEGAVEIEGVSADHHGQRLRVTGKAHAIRGDGRMNATVSLIPTDSTTEPTEDSYTWSVEMIQYPGGYLARLWNLHLATQRALEKLVQQSPLPKGR